MAIGMRYAAQKMRKRAMFSSPSALRFESRALLLIFPRQSTQRTQSILVGTADAPVMTVGTDYGVNGAHDQEVVFAVTTAIPGNYVGTTV